MSENDVNVGTLDSISLMNHIKVGDEELMLDHEESLFLDTLNIDFSKEDWETAYNDKDHIDDLIMAYFTMKKYKQAWDTIENNLDNINFKKIRNCKYFRINTESRITFKHMHDSQIIDDVEYAYYIVISGKLWDSEFFDNYFKAKKCETFGDVLNVLYEARNGLKANEVDLLEMSQYLLNIMHTYLQDDEKLDIYFMEKSVVDVPNEVLTELILGNHFESNEFILSIELARIDNDEDQLLFWKNVIDMLENKNVDIDFAKIDLGAVEDILFVAKHHDIFSDMQYYRLIFNNGMTPYLHHTIDSIYPFNHALDLTKYLEDSYMGLVPSYDILGFNTSGYLSIRNTQFLTYAVYNHESDHLLLGSEVYDYEDFKSKIKIFDEYIDDPDYQYHEKSSYEDTILTTLCQGSDAIYNEFMLSMVDLIDSIDAWKDMK